MRPPPSSMSSLPAAGAFVMQLASSCPLAPNGSSLGLDLILFFNKNRLVCYEPGGHQFIPCGQGLLQEASVLLASALNNDSAWLQRAQGHRRACSQLATTYWEATGLRKVPPQLRIIPSQQGEGDPSVLLSCFVWGFYPPEISVQWLHNGVPFPLQDPQGPPVVSSGDWSYQCQVTLEVMPQPGDTYSCWVQHPSLEEPLLQHWSPGWSPRLKLMVALATVVLAVGLGVFIAGVYWYQLRPLGAGYGPLPGDNYPSG
ncbi:DMB protein, partial [Rhinopomastus cyanomelas]|nr:DMB protein [Rhinopomastus cyanomelas]